MDACGSSRVPLDDLSVDSDIPAAPVAQCPWPRVKVVTPGMIVSVTFTFPIIAFLVRFRKSQTPSLFVAETTFTRSRL